MQSILEVEGERVEKLRDKIQTPEGDFGRQQRSAVVAGGAQFIGGQVDPMAGSRVAMGHGELLESLKSRAQRSRVVALERANTIGSENRNEETEFALIDKLVEVD